MQASGSGTSDEAAGFDGALRAIGKVVSSPTDPDVWNDATSVALKWLLRRTAVDDGALGEDSGTGHWYCPRGCKEVKPTWGEPAEELGFEDFQRVAAFLLRLFGFVTKDDVQKWRDGWRRAITGCVDCAIGHTKAEEILVNEFLMLKHDDATINKWLAGLQKVRNQTYAQLFDQAGLSFFDPTIDPEFAPNLLDLTPPVLASILAHPRSLEESYRPFAQAAARTRQFPVPQLKGKALPGLVLLSASDDVDCAVWARAQLSTIDDSMWKSGMGGAFKALIDRMTDLSLSTTATTSLPGALPNGVASHPTSHPIIGSDPVNVWSGISAVIRNLSPDLFSSPRGVWNVSDRTLAGLRHTVCNHLGDDGPHFSVVLDAFVGLLGHVQGDMWTDEKDGWSEVVLASILDNPTFERAYDTLSGQDPDTAETELFGWMVPFMRSLKDKTAESTYVANLGSIAAVLLERLQQIRFDPPQRACGVRAAVSLLSTICVPEASASKGKEKEGSPPAPAEAWPFAQAVDAKVLDVHAGYLSELAFGPRYAGEEWMMARALATDFIQKVARRDAERLVDGVKRLSEARTEAIHTKTAPTSEAVAALTIHPARGFWNKVYEAIDTKSASGLATILPALAPCAPVDRLATVSWLPAKAPQLASIKPACRAINDALKLVRDPVIERMRDLADAPEAQTLLPTLMRAKGVAEAVMVLAFSPDDNLHYATLTVVRQWADCDSRQECFMELFSRAGYASLRGLITSLRNVSHAAAVLPDAMGLAKRSVRCMTDILEVLCSPARGLLRDDAFVSNLPRHCVQSLWNSMCNSISEIFSKTYVWAEFGQTEDMTDWMRDALIFADRMLEQVWTFQAAASGTAAAGASPTKGNGAASKMVDALTAPTESLLSWLRITEPDLLEKASAVLVRMLERFAHYNRPIKKVVLDKLEKYLRQSQKQEVSQGQKQQIRGVVLSDQQRADITRALARHPEYKQRFEALQTITELDPELRQQQRSEWDKLGLGRTRDRDGDIAYMGSKSAKTDKHPAAPLKMTVGAPKPKPAARPTKPTSAIMSNLKRDFAANRHVLHAGREATSSGPNFRGTTMRDGVPARRGHVIDPSTAAPDDDDDDDEEDEEDRGLAALARHQKPSVAVRAPPGKRTMKRLDDPAYDDYKRRQAAQLQRAAEIRTERLRMKPDFTALHQHILQWDYMHDGPTPPGGPTRFEPIPASFDNHEQYVRLLEPLVMCECWQQIVQAKDEIESGSGEKPIIPCEIAGRASVDDFVEVYTTVKHGSMPERTFFSEADLVLLRNGPRKALAKVMGQTRKPEWFELNLRLHLGSDTRGVNAFLVPKTKWEVVHICSLSTTHREWAVLRSTPYLNLGEDILAGRVRSRTAEAGERAEVAQVAQVQRLNEPQALAVVRALGTPGFSLIQGPPGTGKTSTIVGLVGTFMARRPPVSDVPGPGSISQKILLCAPSNAAVDEIAKRLKEGVRDSRGQIVIPTVVRIGAEAKVNAAVKDIFIDELVEAAIARAEGGNPNAKAGPSEVNNLRSQLQELRRTRDEKKVEASKVQNNAVLYRAMQDDITTVKRKIDDLSQQFDAARDREAANKRSLDATTRKVRMQILTGADVICATLSGSGHDYMSQAPFDFDTVVIDEACQCVEPASLIPLRYNAQKCILVGDPQQLPPTVLSQVAQRAGYNRSLFVRMMNMNPNVVHLLSIQYRMNPGISAFPSKEFYRSRLKDGPDMAAKTEAPWHSNSLFPPYVFYHPRNGRQESGRSRSLLNRGEAALAVAIYGRLVREFTDVDFAYRVGVITGYSAQVGEMKRQFRATFGQDVLSKIDINTVDGFQGQEKDIIIFSCVRGDGSAGDSIGFMKDPNRMNVALTRAKSSLFVLGNRGALQRNQLWSSLIEDAAQRGVISEVDPQTFNAAVPPRIISGNTPQKRAKAKAKGASAGPSPSTVPLYKPREYASQMATQSGIPGLGSMKRQLSSSSPNGDASRAGQTAGDANADVGSSVKKVKLELEDGEIGPPTAPPTNTGSGVQHDSPAPQTTAFEAFAPDPRLAARNGTAPSTALPPRGRGQRGAAHVNGRGRGLGRGAPMNGIGRGAGRGVVPNGVGRGAPGPGAAGAGRGGAQTGRGTPIDIPGQPPTAGPRPAKAPNLFIQKKRPGPPVSSTASGPSDGRSVKQRLQDEIARDSRALGGARQ